MFLKMFMVTYFESLLRRGVPTAALGYNDLKEFVMYCFPFLVDSLLRLGSSVSRAFYSTSINSFRFLIKHVLYL